MAKTLSAYIQNQFSTGHIKPRTILIVDSVDVSSYLLSWNVEQSNQFGANSARFVLDNNSGRFGDLGASPIEVGDVVSFTEYVGNDTTSFPKFYGQVQSRPIVETARDRTIELVCLDFIASLRTMDIDLEVEATKVKVENEVLTPNYLPSPNQALSQIFNFANNSLADDPVPIIMIRNKNTLVDDLQYDGFEILYADGQLKLGTPLNALYNYDIVSPVYYYYPQGLYAEDIIEEIIKKEDSYNGFLFGESSAANVVTNHLTETYNNMEGTNIDYLTPNTSSTSISSYYTLASAVTAGSTVIYLTSVDGLPNAGSGSINGDLFTWTSVENGSELHGIPVSGVYSLKAHNSGDSMKYTATYGVGQVWYLRYSNISTTLTPADFTIPNTASLSHFDARFGRIILDKAISIGATVSCNTNYSFCTLQATGIELNKMSFRAREIENRYEAIQNVKSYLAPNYHIYTRGDSKIWGRYIYQRTTADYTLQLATNLTWREDEDLYTRIIIYGKNKNPTNLMFGNSVSFVGTGEEYKALSTVSDLSLLREEDNYYVYGSPVSGVGRITTDLIKPLIYIDTVPIDNTSHLIVGQSVILETTTRTDANIISGKKF